MLPGMTRKRLAVAILVVLGAILAVIALLTRQAPPPVPGGGVVVTSAPTLPAPTVTKAQDVTGRPWFDASTPYGVARAYLLATKTYSYQDPKFGSRQADAQPYVVDKLWAQISSGMNNPGTAGEAREWAQIQALHRSVTLVVDGMRLNPDVSTENQPVIMVRYHMLRTDDTTSASGTAGPPATISVMLVKVGADWKVTGTTTEAG